ncbi:hypothetical protein [Streptomyces sp. NPDC087212]|uniref:hypothetical protein n=1 Tax=Streptomyces sp. NPDC087212 TaxID=3365766 RepID=UPI0038120E4C
MADQEDPLGVVIGAREVFDEVVGLRGDVRSLIESGEDVRDQLDDHETRIRGLEGERGRFVVPVAVITGVATVVAAGLTVAKLTG